jgi:hypothetical protein
MACARGRTTEAAPVPPSLAGADDESELVVPGQEGDDPPEKVMAAPPSAGAAHAALLAEVDRELAAMRSSTYSHRTHIDETVGAFEYDCSGFLVYALSRAVPDALAAVQATTPRRPRSAEFVAFLETIPAGGAMGRWRRVGRVAELAPGDVIVWLKPPESRSTNTGHTMIVHGTIAPDPEQPGAFIVPIADSTEHPHVPGDVRSGAHRTGLGEAEIVLVADVAGAPAAYRWSRGRKSREKATAITLARLQ